MTWLGPKAYHSKARRKKRKDAYASRNKKQQQRLEKTSARLRENPPASEIWFHSLYRAYEHENDSFNTVRGPYIPDVQNQRYRYIIEIDGSYHDSPEQKLKDFKRNQWFQLRSWKVIRIKAYDENSFRMGIEIVLELRQNRGAVLDDKTAPPPLLRTKAHV